MTAVVVDAQAQQPAAVWLLGASRSAGGRPAGAAGGARLLQQCSSSAVRGRSERQARRGVASCPRQWIGMLGLERARCDGESNANGRRGQAQAGGGGAVERRRSIYFQFQEAEAAEQDGGETEEEHSTCK